MDKKFNKEEIKEFCIAVGIRAIKTMAEVILTYYTIGMHLFDVDWKNVLSLAAGAALWTILVNIVSGVPEVNSDGAILIDDSGLDATKWRLDVRTDPDNIRDRKFIRLKVVPDANLSD